MDPCGSDSFYSHFPSYSQQPTRREALVQERKLEYREFLNGITPRNGKIDRKPQKRHTPIECHSKRQKVPTPNDTPNDKLPKLDTETAEDSGALQSTRVESKNRFLDVLEKMDLPDIINEENINQRNQRLAEEKRLRNIEYQKELMAQIQQKQRERQMQKAKDEEEEERLTKRMEEQLKMVRLQDELENHRQTRQREKSRINLDLIRPIANQSIKPPTTVRSEPLESNVPSFPALEERKIQTDRGKENSNEIKRNDKDIYNFFTNSAQNHTNKFKVDRYSHYFDLEDLSENDGLQNSVSSPTYNTYPSKSVRHKKTVDKQHHADEPPMCNFCKHNRFLARNQEENTSNGLICGSCENEPICLNCRKEICVRCKKPTHDEDISPMKAIRFAKQRYPEKQRNIESEYMVLQQQEPRPKPKYVRLDNLHPIFTDEDDSLSELSSSDHKPFSFNIDDSSMFHPSRSRINRKLSLSIRNGEVSVQPDSFEELKRITEEKLKKFEGSYGAIAKPRDPLPEMRENTRKLVEFANELELIDKNIFRRTEAKRQVNAAQANKVVQNKDATSTLTQLGAFKKQLQLDKMKF